MSSSTASEDQNEIINVNLQITKDCNFKCTYCYEYDQHRNEYLNSDKIESIVAFLVEINKQTKSKIHLTFIGGEPTLNPEVAKEIQKQTHSLGILNSISLITNGWSVKSIKNFFHETIPKSIITVQISYDGLYVSNKYRVRAGKGTGELVRDNFLSLLKEDYNKVVTKSTLPLNELHMVPDIIKEYRQLMRLTNTRIDYMVTEDFTLRGTEFEDKSEEEILAYVNTAFMNILKEEIKTYNEFNHPISKWFNSYTNNVKNNNCHAGSGLININEDGAIQFCHHVDYIDPKNKNDLTIDVLGGTNTAEEAFAKYRVYADKTEKLIEEGVKDCASCKTLYCLKCPIENFALGATREDMYKKHINAFRCTYYLEISKYLQVFDKFKSRPQPRPQPDTKGNKQ